MVLLVMKSSTTIITAYFDIGRGDWTANKGLKRFATENQQRLSLSI